MSKVESLKKQIIELLNKTSSEKIEVNQITQNFIEINNNLNLFYSEVEKSLEEQSLEENNELKNFSLIDQNFVDSLEAFVPKSSRYEINYSLMKFYNILFNTKYFIILNNVNQSEQESIMIHFCNNSLKIINNFRGSPFFQLLIRKAHLYLNYLFSKEKKFKSSFK